MPWNMIAVPDKPPRLQKIRPPSVNPPKPLQPPKPEKMKAPPGYAWRWQK